MMLACSSRMKKAAPALPIDWDGSGPWQAKTWTQMISKLETPKSQKIPKRFIQKRSGIPKIQKKSKSHKKIQGLPSKIIQITAFAHMRLLRRTDWRVSSPKGWVSLASTNRKDTIYIYCIYTVYMILYVDICSKEKQWETALENISFPILSYPKVSPLVDGLADRHKEAARRRQR